jgi:ribulose-5-phosphate 4-epimerase/fuculose-1-phosphate aldolase
MKILIGSMIVIGLFMFFFGSVVISPMVHMETKDIVICGSDIVYYNVTDDGMILIELENGDILEIDSNTNYIDFTVNSEIYIELYQLDESFWWWEEPNFTGDYHIRQIIKIPKS